MIKPLLSRICNGVKLVDSADAVALKVRSLIEHPKVGKGELKVFVSDRSERFQRIASMILGEDISIKEVQTEAENMI